MDHHHHHHLVHNYNHCPTGDHLTIPMEPLKMVTVVSSNMQATGSPNQQAVYYQRVDPSQGGGGGGFGGGGGGGGGGNSTTPTTTTPSASVEGIRDCTRSCSQGIVGSAALWSGCVQCTGAALICCSSALCNLCK
jgi:hypothetical protein